MANLERGLRRAGGRDVAGHSVQRRRHGDEGRQAVRELLSDPVAALRWLDEYEGYVHGGGDRNEYDRVVCEVRLAGGETFDAWVYLLRRVPPAERRIDSGRWVRS